MKSSIDCIPCYFRQVLSISKRVTDDKELQLSAFKKAMEVASGLSLEASPAENTYCILKEINKVLGCNDPFKADKEKYNKISLKMYPRLCDIAAKSDNPLFTAIKIAVAGNIIDLGIQKSFDISGTLNRILENGFAIDHFDRFKRVLDKARNALYLADNAGEIVFDRVLIEQLKKHCSITVVVNEGPILNDATLEDALAVGLDKVAEIVTTGTDTIGKVLDKSSAQFRKLINSADLVVAKGHANYETLNDTKFNIFFLLQAKCDVVAESLKVKCGDAVLVQNVNYSRGAKNEQGNQN